MNIYVGNLSPQVTEQELWLEFGAFGEVTSVFVVKDDVFGGGRANRHAYVQMASTTAGAAAVSRLDGKRLKSESIRTIEALPLSPKKGKSAKR